VAPGLWGEPFDAVSNVAFLVAAVALAVQVRRAGRRGSRGLAAIAVLSGELAAIGVFSAGLHTFATSFAAELDNWSIIIFIHTYVVCFVHYLYGVRWRFAWLAAPVYAGASLGTVAVVAEHVGERATVGGYLPAILLVIGMAGASLLSQDPGRRAVGWPMAGAALAILVAITARTVDHVKHEEAWAAGSVTCDLIPSGTHFLWHLFAAAGLYLASVALVRRAEAQPGVTVSQATETGSTGEPLETPAGR
jgi:hypothetical protein